MWVLSGILTSSARCASLCLLGGLAAPQVRCSDGCVRERWLGWLPLRLCFGSAWGLQLPPAGVYNSTLSCCIGVCRRAGPAVLLPTIAWGMPLVCAVQQAAVEHGSPHVAFALGLRAQRGTPNFLVHACVGLGVYCFSCVVCESERGGAF